jgi:hypothetical protein
MLNLNKLFLEAEKKKETENFAHFGEDVFFKENDIFEYFGFFDRKEAFTKTKK